MNKNLRSLLALLVWIVALGACTNERIDRLGVEGGEGNLVSFTLNTGALRAQGDETNTRPTPALDREKEVTDLYAVVYKTGSGVFYKTIKCDHLSGEDYTFDSERAGSYFFFLVANPDDALLAKLKTGPATKEDLAKVIAEQTPGEDATAAHFLMTSKLTQVTTQAAQTVSVADPILLERVSARFDFYNNIDDFVITKITFKKRYTTSHLFPLVKKMDELTFTEDKVYTPESGASGVIATIYGYENDTRGETYFILEGTYKGKEIEPQEVRLESMVVKRNHLYNIYIHTPGGETKPSTDPNIQSFGKVSYMVRVMDWNLGNELTLDADDVLKPMHIDYKAHLSNAPYMDSFLIDSPREIYTTTKEKTNVTLTLGNYMQAGSITFDGDAPEGVTLKEVEGSLKTDPLTGKITKEYTLSLPAEKGYANAPLELNGTKAGDHAFREVKLIAYNALKNESIKFSVKHGRPKMAIEYLTEYNLAPVEGYDINAPLTDDQLANLKFVTSHDNDASGYFNPFYSVKQLKNIAVEGKSCHMAKDSWEWYNIIPSRKKIGNENYEFVGATAVDYKGVVEYMQYLPWYKTLAPKAYYYKATADYKSTADKMVTFAVRFKNHEKYKNIEQVAVKYEWIGGTPTEGAKNTALKVTFRYLGDNWNGQIENVANLDFWNENNESDVSRILPLVGYQQDSSIKKRGITGQYISTKVNKRYENDPTPFTVGYIEAADVSFKTGTTSDYMTGGWLEDKSDHSVSNITLFYAIRLFEDE